MFPLKGVNCDFVVAEQMTVNRPLGVDRIIRQPRYHLIRSETRQSADVDEENDHVIQEEVAQAFDMKLFCPFKSCLSYSMNGY